MTSRNEKSDPAKQRAARAYPEIKEKARFGPVAMSMANAIATSQVPGARAAQSSSATTGAPPRKPRRPSNRAMPRSDQTRLAELKAKLGDADYMNGAILRIATVLSARLTLR